MAERPMEHFTVDGVNIFEVTDAKARQDCSDLKDDLDSITGKRGLDSIAFGSKTYRDIFERNNLIPFGDFESGLGWISGNTNGAVISDDASYSRNHSLKCFGTSSVQIRKDIKSLSRIDIDIICKVKVDRYVSGGGAGFFYSDNKLINHVTDGWETVYQGRTAINANETGSFFFGTVSAANCDAYIDDICVINLSGLWESSGNYPTQTKMKELYEEWIEIKNLQKKERNKKTYVGAVIDATDADARFKAMRQLLNIATAKSNDPGFDVPASAYTYASKGTVIELPENPSMYEKINVDALFSANGDVQAIPASTTKVMTLITGIDFIDNINEVITITSSDIQTGSGNVFEAGDTCTIKDLMYTMLLPSSNTGAWAFARVCGEKILAYRGITSPTDQEAYNTFITQMGIKATDIGMINSAFDSASGLSSSNKTTTNDMIHMMIEACSYPDICKIWGKNSYTFSVGGQNPRSITVDTTVTDAGIESEYILLGGKTGHMYVDQSQACALVIVAKEK